MRTSRATCEAIVLLGAVLPACGADRAAPRPVVVFAASSLTAPFAAIERAFEAAHPGIDVQCAFAGSPQLVLQLQEGAAADVFAAADTATMQKVATAGRLAEAPRSFARNRLAIVVAAGNPRGIRGLADFARRELVVALCGPEVPAGRYARQAFSRAGIAVRSASDEPNVQALVAKVRLGELDAGVVYATDGAGNGTELVAIPAEHQVAVEYPIARCRAGTADGGSAAAFVDFVASPAGQRLLASFGFEAP